ncbi:MAG: chemotaxis protein CheX [Planctomycetota bacterium]
MGLNEEQLDALAEIVNIGVGRGAASLNALVDQRIELRVPKVRLCGLSELQAELEGVEEPVDTSVVQGFSGTITGSAMLAFPQRSGVALARLLAEEEVAEDEDALEFDLAGILEEIGNIVLNGVLGSLANLFEDDFRYSVPELCTGRVSQALTRDVALADLGGEPTCLLADARFDLADSQIGGSLLLAFNTDELALLLDQLLMAAEA